MGPSILLLMSTAEHTTSDKCIHCSSLRVAQVCCKVSDMFSMSMGLKDYTGYVPSNIGFGDNEDYIDFRFCLDCLKMQRTSAVRHIAALETPRKLARKAPRGKGEALPELQSMPAKWPGQCACGAAYVAGEAIDYSLTIQAVVGCPCCNAKRAAKAA